MTIDSKFSARAIRSFGRSVLSKIDATLMASSGAEYAEADLKVDPDSVEESAIAAEKEREAQHAVWRAAFLAQELSRQARQEEYQSLRESNRVQSKKRIKDLLAQEKELKTCRVNVEGPSPISSPSAILEEDPCFIEDQPAPDPESYTCPTALLFDRKKDGAVFFVSEEELEEQKRVVQDTLDSFSVDATVWDAVVGPRVTQLRLRPASGVRVESISSLSKNLALALSAESIRIQAPIPGQPYVGIEIPNGNSAPLNLGALFRTSDWTESLVHIPLLLGMEIGGAICVTDLGAAPHMLIAGATGSGKSVCINTLLMSLLCRFSPDELELILVDPKRVEFGAYQEIPHLVRPVITESNLVCPALKWVIREMEKRYQMLAAVSLRNIADYNGRMDELGLKRMPFLVVIIDELADIMLTSGAEVEIALARIAQMSRAVGIHTVIATQRPSVNVITGTIKANYPTRVAFKVTSQIDSRSILDGKGAESLRGKGDMLFSPPGIGQLRRVQGPFVTDEEIQRVVAYCAKQRKQKFNSSAMDLDPVSLEPRADQDASEVEDPMLDKAIEAILGSHRASTSYLQRRLRIGYNRAATLIDELEARGVIGPQIGSTPREILVDRVQKEAL